MSSSYFGSANTLPVFFSGIRMGSMGLFLQCATSTFFSLVMSRLVRHFGSRWVYLSSMVSFTLSALVICLSKSVVLVTGMAALTGYAYATLQTLPYTLTCHYHKEKEVRVSLDKGGQSEFVINRNSVCYYDLGPNLQESHCGTQAEAVGRS